MNIQSKTFLTALKKLRPAVNPKPAMPILGSFLVSNGALTATSLDVTITEKLPDANGANFLLPYTEVVNICNNVSGELEVTSEQIKNGKAKFKLGAPEDVKSFPKQAEKLKDAISFKASYDVVAAIIKASKCVTKESFDPKSNVHLSYDNGIVKVQGTNGHILFIEQFKVDCEKKFAVKIPVSFITCVPVAECTISVTENKISIESDTTTVSGLLVDGSYPDTSVVFEQSYPQQISLNRYDLIEALRTVAVYNILPECQFSFNKDEISMVVIDEDRNRIAETKIEQPNDIEITSIKFNAELFQLLLSLFPESEDDITLQMSSPQRGALVTMNNTDIKCLIMPMA